MSAFGMLCHHLDLTTDSRLCSFEPGFVSRKYNGWSVIWDGGITRDQPCLNVPWAYEKDHVRSTGLWSLARSKDIPEGMSKVIMAPEYFLDALPQGIPLHGEIWYNDRLDIVKETVGTRVKVKPMWQAMQFLAFNIKPYNMFHNIHKIPHKENYEVGKEFIEVVDILKALPSNEYFQPIGQTYVNTVEEFEAYTKMAESCGWEGVMLSKPSGLYELARSYNVMKWKVKYETEGTVVGYEDGKTGRCVGQVGAIQVKLTWDDKVLSVFGGMKHQVGKTVSFNVSGLFDDERNIDDIKQRYPIGSELHFTYYGVTFDGIPQSANIMRD